MNDKQHVQNNACMYTLTHGQWVLISFASHSLLRTLRLDIGVDSVTLVLWSITGPVIL